MQQDSDNEWWEEYKPQQAVRKITTTSSVVSKVLSAHTCASALKQRKHSGDRSRSLVLKYELSGSSSSKTFSRAEQKEWDALHNKIRANRMVASSKSTHGRQPSSRQDNRRVTISLSSTSMSTHNSFVRPNFWTKNLGSGRMELGRPSIKESKNIEVLSAVRRILHRKQKDKNIRMWLRSFRKVLLVVRMSRSMKERTYEAVMQLKTFLDFASMNITDEHTSAKALYATNRAEKKDAATSTVKRETRRILNTPPEVRSPSQVKKLLSDLQYLHAFCCFPLSTQQLMAEQGSYQYVAPRRVIIRQGHTALFYYFILSGVAQATKVKNYGSGKARFTESMLTQGHSFGQEAILDEQPHEYTVISYRPLQLLTIPATHFYNVVKEDAMHPHPVHVRYLSQQAWMKHWPIRQLIRHPAQTFMYYARDRQVIVADSLEDEYLYVVRSGKCVVMKKILNPLSTHSSWRDKRQSKSMGGSSSSTKPFESLKTMADDGAERRKSKQVSHTSRGYIFPSQKAFYRRGSALAVLESALRDALSESDPESSDDSAPSAAEEKDRRHSTRTVDSDAQVCRTKKSSRAASRMAVSSKSAVPSKKDTSINTSVPSGVSSKTAVPKETASTSKTAAPRRTVQSARTAVPGGTPVSNKLAAPSGTALSSETAAPRGRAQSARTAVPVISELLVESDAEENGEKEGGEDILTSSTAPTKSTKITVTCSDQNRHRRLRLRRRRLQKQPPRRSILLSHPSTSHKRRSFVTWLKAKEPSKPSAWWKRKMYNIPRRCVPAFPPAPHQIMPEDKPQYLFFNVRTLKEGDVFGFDQMRLPMFQTVQPWGESVSLVSCGAEVVALRKHFFLQYANMKTQQLILNICIATALPSTSDLESKQRENLSWDLYTRRVADELLQDIRSTRKLSGIYFHPEPPLDPRKCLRL